MARGLTLNEQAVLGALLLGPKKASDLLALFGPKGPFHPARRLAKPQVYRALERLLALGLVEALGLLPSPSGPPGAVYALTPIGKEAAEAWLRAPCRHLPEARALLRLKLVLHLLLGRDPRPLLLGQRAVYLALEEALAQRAAQAQGPLRLHLLWQREMAQAGRRYVEGLLGEA